MQFRMKTHQLPQEQIEVLLQRSPAGCLATVGADGSPYAVPVHFIRMGGSVYLHGLPAGQKLDNIRAEQRVCLTVWEMRELLLDGQERPCAFAPFPSFREAQSARGIRNRGRGNMPCGVRRRARRRLCPYSPCLGRNGTRARTDRKGSGPDRAGSRLGRAIARLCAYEHRPQPR